MADTHRDEIELEELQDRMVFAALRPGGMLARRFGFTLNRLKKTLETVYFQETRDRGLSLREISDVMQISMSKTSLLSRQLKQAFMSEASDNIKLRLEYMLANEPMTLARINQVITDAKFVEIERSLRELVDSGRIIREGRGSESTYHLNLDPERGDWDIWLMRLRSIERALKLVARAIAQHHDDEGMPPRITKIRVPRRLLQRLGDSHEDVWSSIIFRMCQEAGLKPREMVPEEWIELDVVTFFSTTRPDAEDEGAANG